jgi:putative effector of murein hydrolase LrgA (UPF0299 family)
MTDLRLFLEIAGVDFLQLTFLVVAWSADFLKRVRERRTRRKKKVALLACSEA